MPYDGLDSTGTRTTYVFVRHLPTIDGRPGGFFEFNDGTPPQKELTVCILDTRLVRSYWGNLRQGPPICRSLDGNVSINGTPCAKCEYSQWHNNVPPACRVFIQANCLALLPDGEVKPCIMSLGGKNRKEFQNYMVNLLRTEPYIEAYKYFIRFSLVPDQTSRTPRYCLVGTPKNQLQQMPDDWLRYVESVRETLSAQFYTSTSLYDETSSKEQEEELTGSASYVAASEPSEDVFRSVPPTTEAETPEPDDTSDYFADLPKPPVIKPRDVSEMI